MSKDTPKPKTPGVYEVPDVPDSDVPHPDVPDPEDDFPDTWGDEPSRRPHNEPEAEPLSDPSPLSPNQPSL